MSVLNCLQSDQIWPNFTTWAIVKNLYFFGIWQNFKPTLTNLLCLVGIGKIFIVVSGKILKKYLAIWSHWLRVTFLRFFLLYFINSFFLQSGNFLPFLIWRANCHLAMTFLILAPKKSIWTFLDSPNLSPAKKCWNLKAGNDSCSRAAGWQAQTDPLSYGGLSQQKKV